MTKTKEKRRAPRIGSYIEIERTFEIIQKLDRRLQAEGFVRGECVYSKGGNNCNVLRADYHKDGKNVFIIANDAGPRCKKKGGGGIAQGTTTGWYRFTLSGERCATGADRGL